MYTALTKMKAEIQKDPGILDNRLVLRGLFCDFCYFDKALCRNLLAAYDIGLLKKLAKYTNRVTRSEYRYLQGYMKRKANLSKKDSRIVLDCWLFCLDKAIPNLKHSTKGHTVRAKKSKFFYVLKTIHAASSLLYIMGLIVFFVLSEFLEAWTMEHPKFLIALLLAFALVTIIVSTTSFKLFLKEQTGRFRTVRYIIKIIEVALTNLSPILILYFLYLRLSGL